MEQSKTSQRENWLQERAAKEPFLTTRDELPRLLELFSKLEASFESELETVDESCTRQTNGLQKQILENSDTLLALASQISESFDSLDKEVESDQVLALSRDLRNLVPKLYREVRGRTSIRLQALASHSGVVPKSIRRLKDLYNKTREQLPESAPLIISRKGDANMSGKTILEEEFESLITIPSKRKYSILASLHFQLVCSRLRFRYQIFRIPFKEGFSDHFVVSLNQLEPKLVSEQESHFSALKSRIDEAWQIVRFNLDTAAAELEEIATKTIENPEERLAELRQMAVDSLKRAEELLKELEAPFSQSLNSCIEAISANHNKNRDLILQDLRSTQTSRVRIRWFLQEMRIAARNLARRVSTLVKDGIGWVSARALKTGLTLEDLIILVGSWLGLSIRSKERLLTLSDLPRAREVTEKLQSLPPIYRRLFTDEPLRSREFMVGREKEIDDFKEVVERWKSGRRASIAIVGQIGSGKTSLINHLRSDLEAQFQTTTTEMNERVHTEKAFVSLIKRILDLKASVNSYSSLVDLINQGERRIVFLEGGHSLLLRAVDGRKTAELFFRLLMATRENILWVLSIRERPWAMLKYQVNADLYFTHELHTRLENPEDLKSALLSRHRSSGAKLIYLDDGVSDRKFRKLRATKSLDSEAIQTHLEESFFNQLYEVSGGNMTAAMYFWLTSLTYNRGWERLEMKPCIKPDLSPIRSFNHLALFSLAEILNHSVLTLKEHSLIFQIPEMQSRLVLDYLVNLRLVESEETSEGSHETFCANPVLVHHLCKTLESMNIIY